MMLADETGEPPRYVKDAGRWRAAHPGERGLLLRELPNAARRRMLRRILRRLAKSLAAAGLTIA